MGVLYIVEGHGGSRRSRDGVARRVVAAAGSAGWTPSIVSLEELGRHVADRAHPVARVVLCGGDGLIHRALPLVVGSDIEVAIVPVGSGNDFVRSFGIDGDEAVRLAASPPSTNRSAAGVDVITVAADRADTVVLAASVLTAGYSGRVTATANRMRFPPGSAKYTAAALREIGRLTPVEARIALTDADGRELEVIEGPLTMFAVGNTGFFGGGMHICPNADATDGQLDVVAVGPIGRLDFMRWLPRVFKGSHLDHAAVTTGRAGRVMIETAEPLWADGEQLHALHGQQVHVVRAQPGALRLLRAT
ncbi:MAG TPA: diacylglycerol kinase family protein [Ilumatobacter sp.]|nr:diacylglycerol kinase family protein [Ilumatobacter sp.]